MFEIEKNVPIPETHAGRIRKYPWQKMEVGDSFFVPNGNRNSLTRCAHAAGARLERKFSARRVEGGMRVWRVA